jgi:hypothetical protein
MINKSYTINNKNFKLKTDLTLDEAEEVQELFKNLFISDEQASGQEYRADGMSGVVSGSFSNTEIKRFLSLTLEPQYPNTGPGSKGFGEFDYGKVKESVAIEVIKDFFLHRIKKYQDFTQSCAESMKLQLRP